MVRNSSRKFIGIFLLQGVCVLTIILLSYFFVYNSETCKYSFIVLQLNLNVFPIFDILMPSAFIVYTHYVNFSED